LELKDGVDASGRPVKVSFDAEKMDFILKALIST
jgi:hypothetical protein